MPSAADDLILSLDRGNSSLDCLLEGQGISRTARLRPQLEDLQAFLGDCRPDLAVACSAVPGGLDQPRELLAAIGCEILVAGEDMPCPLELDYAEGQLGVDRWVAALAACRQFGAALLVDAGSAVTIDLVTAEGRFLGGVIAPGRAALKQGLAALAPSLPSDQIEDLPRLPPLTSGAAVGAGLSWGYLSMVDGLVSRLLSASSLKATRLVLTGGDAELLARESSHRFELRPALIHEGLACLLSEYRSRS